MGIGLAGSMRAARAQQPANQRFAAFDKGPATIDVSSYSPEMQGAYLVFTKKCGACHTVARAINSDLVLEGEWEADVHEMATRAGRMISPDDAAQIYDFLVYDSKIRKVDLYLERQRQVAAASPILTAQPSLDRTSTGRRSRSPRHRSSPHSTKGRPKSMSRTTRRN